MWLMSACYSTATSTIIAQSIWDLWLMNCLRQRFYTENFRFLLPVSFHHCTVLFLSPFIKSVYCYQLTASSDIRRLRPVGMNAIEWLAFFCSTFDHILPFQIRYCFYVYRYIHVSKDDNTEYFLIALRTEIESFSIQRFQTIRTPLMGSKIVQYFKTIYISILLNTGDCEIFNIEIEFTLTSNQPGGVLYINTQKLARDSVQKLRVRVALVLPHRNWAPSD